MTEEQLSLMRSLLEDFNKLADIAIDMNWMKTDTKHIMLRIPIRLNGLSLVTDPFLSISSFEFEKCFVHEHFAEAVTQVLMAAVTLDEGCDADEEWQDNEQRCDKLKTYWGIPVWHYLEYEKVEMTEDSVEEMKKYICSNAVYDHKIQKHKDYEMPPEALSILSYFHDAKLYVIDEECYTGYGGRIWIALKEDTFLWVKYSGITD